MTPPTLLPFRIFSYPFNITLGKKMEVEVMTEALLEWETLESSQIDEIMAGKKPTPPEMNTKDDKPKGGASGDSEDDAPSLDESDLDLPDPSQLN